MTKLTHDLTKLLTVEPIVSFIAKHRQILPENLINSIIILLSLGQQFYVGFARITFNAWKTHPYYAFLGGGFRYVAPIHDMHHKCIYENIYIKRKRPTEKNRRKFNHIFYAVINILHDSVKMSIRSRPAVCYIYIYIKQHKCYDDNNKGSEIPFGSRRSNTTTNTCCVLMLADYYLFWPFSVLHAMRRHVKYIHTHTHTYLT